ncbi:MAG: FAD-binding oxidoreductase [Halobacteriota archaeon]
MTNSTNGSADLIDELDRHFGDRCLRPGDGAYDEAIGLWNAAAQAYPSLVVRCLDTGDVVAALEAVTSHDTPFSVKGGGHMTTGAAVVEDGVVFDLSPMDDVSVDESAGTVRVGGGATWPEVNQAALERGLIPPGIPDTAGVAGFTLGGGMGVTCRLAGLACDNLREAEVVTAGGSVVSASEDENADLFWALRGGSGNVGIATALEFDCVRGDRDCLVANVLYPINDAEAYLDHFAESVDSLPDATFPVAAILEIPPLPDLPEALHGETAVAGYVMGVGTDEELKATLEDFADFGNPHVAAVYPVDYTDLYEPFQIDHGQRHHWESFYLDALTDDFVEALLNEATPLATPTSSVAIYGLGGAIDRVAHDATAYAHRGAPFAAHIQTHWTDPDDDDRYVEWTRSVHEALRGHGTGGEYVNNQTDKDDARIEAAYGDHYDRLAAVKAECDPEDRFRSTQHVAPDAAGHD